MERRQFSRIKIGYKVRIISESATIEGVIDDLSESGVSVMSYSSEQPMEIKPEMQVTLNFQTDSGENIDLLCRVKWMEEKGRRNRIGMELIDPPWEKSASFL